MKKFLMGAAAALAIAAPSAAAAQGYVGGVYVNNEVEALGADVEAWGAEGAFLVSPSIEIDAAILDGDDETAYGVTGHLFSRNDSHLFGGFLGAAGGEDSTTWSAGLEASKYFSGATLSAALSYINNDDAEVDGFGVDLSAGMFATDNLRFDAAVGWGSFDSGIGDDNALTYGVGFEVGFGSLPISLATNWTHAELDETNVEIETLKVALRYNFGSENLRDRDRSGASQADRTGSFAGLF